MKITVIGLELIGGSMALDLKVRGFCSHIIGVDNDPEHCRQATEKGFADEIKQLTESLQSEIIILATPVTETAKILPQILDSIGENTVVMDTGATKHEICKAIKKHPKRKQFVGTHPIAGTENLGIAFATHNLFDNKTVILCVEDSALWVVEKVSALYEALNMKPIFMKADEHDLHMTCVSHLPHISSFALAATVLEMEKKPAVAADLADTDFASSVGLAKSSPEIWSAILEQNAKNISRALNTHIKHLTRFKNYIDKKNAKGIHEAIQKANAIRKILK